MRFFITLAALLAALIVAPETGRAYEPGTGTWVHHQRQAPQTDIGTIHNLPDGTILATTNRANHVFDGTRWHKLPYDTERFDEILPFFCDSSGKLYYYNLNVLSVWDSNHPDGPMQDFTVESTLDPIKGGADANGIVYIGSSNSANGGIYRFDGIDLTKLRGGQTFSLTVDHEARLWAVHRDSTYNLLVFDDDTWTDVSGNLQKALDANTVVATAPDGAVWVNTFGAIDICRDDIWEHFSAGTYKPRLITFDDAGNPWGILDTKLYRWVSAGAWEETYTFPVSLSTPFFFASMPDNRNFIINGQNLAEYNETSETWSAVPNPYDLGSDTVTCVTYTDDGYLVCGHGIPGIPQEQWENAGISMFDGETWYNKKSDGIYQFPNVYALYTIPVPLRQEQLIGSGDIVGMSDVMVSNNYNYDIFFSDFNTWGKVDSLTYQFDDLEDVRIANDFIVTPSGDRIWIATSYGLFEHDFIGYPVKLQGLEISNSINYRNLFMDSKEYLYMQTIPHGSVLAFFKGSWLSVWKSNKGEVRDYIIRYRQGDPYVWTAQNDGLFAGLFDQISLTPVVSTDDSMAIVLPNASLVKADEDDNIWASGYNNTGYIDEDGVWHRIPELENMQANRVAFYYADKIALNSIQITRIETKDFITYDGVWEYTAGATVVEENPSPFELESINYPNPFNAATIISFTLPANGNAALDIFSITGQRIRRLADGPFHVGANTVRWDGRTDSGDSAASGIYFYRVSFGDAAATGKMLLLK